MRTKLLLITLVMAAGTGCGGGDSAGGGAGGSGNGGQCAGVVDGSATGSFSDCIATLNYYPDGGQLVGGRRSSLFSMIVGSGIGTATGVDSVGINFELGALPAPGSYALSDAGAATMAYVGTGSGTFSNVASATLVLSQVESLGEDTSSGERAESFLVAGSVDFVVRDGAGAQLSVSASF